MKIEKRLLPVLAALLLLGGCQQKEEEPWVPERTAISVSREGRVTETIIDHMDESYYSDSELRQMVDESLKEYAASHGSERISLEEFTVNGTEIRVVLGYASGEDYASFNHVRFYSGSMLGAQMEGYRFETFFQLVAKDGTVSQKRIAPDGPVSHKEYQVLVTDRSHMVEVPGGIVYVSAPSQVQDRRIVTPLNIEEDTDHSTVSADEAGLLYILYEYE